VGSMPHDAQRFHSCSHDKSSGPTYDICYNATTTFIIPILLVALITCKKQHVTMKTLSLAGRIKAITSLS